MSDQNPYDEIEAIIREMESPSISERRWAYREAASVQVSFHPASLKPLGEGPANVDEAYASLVDDSYETDGNPGRRFLKREVRQETFRRMTPEKMRQVLAANPPVDDDSTQRVLSSLILGNAVDPIRWPIGELEAAGEVLSWFPENFPGLPSGGEIERILPRRRLFARFPGIDTFVGRDRELLRIEKYLEVANDSGAPDEFRRDVPAVLFGVGGIGKSALIGAFLRRFANEREALFPFVYLDFDNPLLRIGEQKAGLGKNETHLRMSNVATILLEGINQIEAQYPESREYFKALREDLVVRSRDTNGPKLEASRDLCRRFGSAVMRTVGERSDVPLLIVLDTFEEAQAGSRSAEVQLAAFFRDLREGYPNLRMLVSGRAEPVDLSAALRGPVGWRLWPLGRLACYSLLTRLGVQDEKFQRDVYREIGGSPLDLHLVAHLIRLFDVESYPPVKRVEWLTSNTVDGSLVTGHLYLRIVDHLHSKDGRHFANPGLVLRRITPEALLSVLNQPCGLQLAGIEDAKKFFENLERETFLFDRPRGRDFLRIRQDVRPGVLKLIEKSSPSKVIEIETAAIDFLQSSSEVIDRADEIYYRLRRGHPAKIVDARWISGVEPYLAQSIPELPEESRLFLAAKLRILVSGNVRRSASSDAWEGLATFRRKIDAF